MLIIPLLADAFPTTPSVFLQTQRPWTVSVFPPEHMQHTVSPFWFSSFDNNLTSPGLVDLGSYDFHPACCVNTRKWVLVFIAPSFILQRLFLWQPSSSNAESSDAASSGRAAFFFFFFFFTNHCQLTLKAGKRWHLHFHYPLIKSSRTNIQEQHVKRSQQQGDKLAMTVNSGGK